MGLQYANDKGWLPEPRIMVWCYNNGRYEKRAEYAYSVRNELDMMQWPEHTVASYETQTFTDDASLKMWLQNKADTIKMLNTTASSMIYRDINKKGETVEAVQVQPAVTSEVLNKAKITAGLLGIVLTPQDINILQEFTTTSQCNKYIMERKAGQVRVSLTEQQKEYIREATSAKNSALYRDKKRAHDQIASNISHYHNTIDSEYRKLYQIVRELRKIESEAPTQDLVPSIEATLADGWYTLFDVTSEYIVLTTGVVHCAHPDIKLSVELGQFNVKFNFHTGAVSVTKFKNNIDLDGYLHPHLNAGGSICWGNANNTYQQARRSLDVELLYRTIRTLLSVYNPASPYTTLHEFDYNVNKDKYDKLKQVYVSAKTLGRGAYSIETRDCISDAYIEWIDDDEDSVYIYEAFFKVYENTPVTVDDHVYVRDGSDFVEVDEYEWR